MSGASSTTRIFSLLTGVSSLLPHTRRFWQRHLKRFDERRISVGVCRVGCLCVRVEALRPLVDSAQHLAVLIGLGLIAVGVDQCRIRADHPRRIHNKTTTYLTIVADCGAEYREADLVQLALVEGL